VSHKNEFPEFRRVSTYTCDVCGAVFIDESTDPKWASVERVARYQGHIPNDVLIVGVSGHRFTGVLWEMTGEVCGKCVSRPFCDVIDALKAANADRVQDWEKNIEVHEYP
jgi:hypothetical protein